jgi:hypothetical protein
MQGTLLSEFRHYLNLNKTAIRLHQLLRDFRFGPVYEKLHPICEQVRTGSPQMVPDLVTGDYTPGRHDSQPCNKERLCSAPAVPD